MEIIDLRDVEDSNFEIKLGGLPRRITADTMAEALVGFSAALEEINRLVNPGYSAQLYVEDISPGSVRIRLSLTKTQKAAIAGAAVVLVGDIAVELLGNYLYDALNPPPPPALCKTEVLPDGSVKFSADGRCEQILSREAYERLSAVRKNPRVAAAVSTAVEAVERDPHVTSLGVSKPKQPPRIEITRPQMRKVIEHTRERMPPGYQFVLPHAVKITQVLDAIETTKEPAPVTKKRTRETRANLVIIKAVLLRSKRKWQFNWNGIKVSAPIKDASFFDKLEAGDIALHQGDALDADLLIKQEFIEAANVWQNKSYEVVKVYSVTLGESQKTMTF